jgi:hypothetical protein
LTSLVELNSSLHRHLRIDERKVEETAADLHLIPLVVSEFGQAIAQFPIFFSKNAETGQFTCVALAGFEEGENLYWNKAKFDSVYIPLSIRRQPFFVGQDERTDSDFVICINPESHAISSQHGIAIFDSLGEPTEYLRNTQGYLAALLNGEEQNKELIDVLVQHHLLVPLSLELTFVDDQTRNIKGLYSIDEEKLKQLNVDKLNVLNQSGLLHSMYTQINSLAQIYVLLHKKNQRLMSGNPWFTNAKG